MDVKVITKARKLAMLNALKATGGVLETPTVILLRDLPPADALTDAVVVGDLVESAFGGYAAKTAVAFGAAHVGLDGTYKMVAPSANFIFNGTDPEVVKGYAVVNAAKDAVYSVTRFEEPINLTIADQGFEVIPEFPLVA